jgi:uncharacterized protein YggU (UPF0235/DUF167 family)
VTDGELRVRVAAPPVDGAANQALLRLLADELGVPRRATTLLAGETSRRKRITVAGISAEELRIRWPGLVG